MDEPDDTPEPPLPPELEKLLAPLDHVGVELECCMKHEIELLKMAQNLRDDSEWNARLISLLDDNTKRKKDLQKKKDSLIQDIDNLEIESFYDNGTDE
mmetsp:Transcript_19185/g.47435  ORF Transcript_19185/g.47435 Transcript_19185/m.47435 type:complete len:98 (-) Transcript_19185:1784-2077(-)